jgi:hypothetical protein
MSAQVNNILSSFSIAGTPFVSGKNLKYQEFTSSGTFTPTSAAISAGGVHQVFIVGGGERGSATNIGGAGGEVIERFTTLTNTTGCAVTIGAGGTSNGADGGSSTFAGSSAGGVNIVAAGGAGLQNPTMNSQGAGGSTTISAPSATISVTLPGATISSFTPGPSNYWYAYAYQRAYASAYQSAYAYGNSAGSGYKGFGAGGNGGVGGMATPKANSGAGSAVNINAASGYCLITWYE